MSLWILLLLLCSWHYQSSAISCNLTQYEKDGSCCSLCKPGQRLKKDCTENSETECLNCTDGEYQDKWNRETSCLLHHHCDRMLGFMEISEGTPFRNVNCSCQMGRHCSSISCETCSKNSPCSPGAGVTQRADGYSDTKCSPCAKGTFSTMESYTEPCIHWRICSETEQEVRPGNSTTDVLCGPRPASYTWIYVIFLVACVLVVVLIVTVVIWRSWKVKNQNKQNPPKENVQQLLDKPYNLPVEDQDITMQGLPVAQEQGKDYHMSQEEV